MRKIPYFLCFVAFVLLIVEYGFPWTKVKIMKFHIAELLLALYFTFRYLLEGGREKFSKVYLKENIGETVFLSLFFLSIVLLSILLRNPIFHKSYSLLPHFTPYTPFFLPLQIFLSLEILLHVSDLPRLFVHLPLKPGQLVVVTYLSIIILGTLLLSLPQAQNGGEISWLDRLFTASSATCVTGLTVVDISQVFTPYGQSIILLLIQIGGLGLVTFVTFFALLMGKGIGFRERAFLKDVLDYEVIGEMGRLVITILLVTFALEGMGTLVLSRIFSHYPEKIPSPFFFGLFHSVSAFCNAGFSLFKDSLRGFKDSISINLTFGLLIIIGGLGFLVIRDVLRFLIRRIRRKPSVLSLHTRLVLITTGILLFCGFAGFMILLPLGIYSFKERTLISFFQSVTARTAGFSTIDISTLPSPIQLLLIFLMFIGASPGSTGGGIKTSTFAVVLITVFSYLKGKERVEVFARTIPPLLVHRIIAIVSFSLFLVFFSTILLTLTEDYPFLSLLFEAVSAFGTVGLSHGITPYLSPWGKMTLIVTMLIGRIGPLTLAVAMGPRVKKVTYKYPEERVLVG